MLSRRIVPLAALVVLALLAPRSLFALGRDLTPPRMATPDYSLDSIAAVTSSKGFLLLWSSQTHGYGMTADAALPLNRVAVASRGAPVASRRVASTNRGLTGIVKMYVR